RRQGLRGRCWRHPTDVACAAADERVPRRRPAARAHSATGTRPGSRRGGRAVQGPADPGGGDMSGDLTRMTAAGLAAAIGSGEASAEEVTRAHLDRISAVDPQVHAFLHVDADGALAAARAVDQRRAAGDDLGPLAGVPLALKDVFTTVDMPTTCGSKILEGWRPPYDATVTRRLREAGIVILGKTN